jgi:phosphoribosylformylglycinamidine synthase subunit PurS
VRFRVLVEAMPKEGIADPQGVTIEEHLPALGWSNVREVRVGKAIHLTIEAESLESARAQADEMSRRFLANPVLESWLVSVNPGEWSASRDELAR